VYGRTTARGSLHGASSGNYLGPAWQVTSGQLVHGHNCQTVDESESAEANSFGQRLSEPAYSRRSRRQRSTTNDKAHQTTFQPDKEGIKLHEGVVANSEDEQDVGVNKESGRNVSKA